MGIEKKDLDKKEYFTSKEKKEKIKSSVEEKIKKLKELLKSLGIDNIGELNNLLNNIDKILDGLELADLEKIAQKIKDEIIVLIEKDNRIKNDEKMKINLLLNGEESKPDEDFGDNSNFVFL